MIDDYRILNLSLAKQEGKITDEMVKEKYLEKKQLALKMKDDKRDDYLTILEDAYYALATENARKHYDELIIQIEKHIQVQKHRKTNLKNIIQQSQQNIDTKELLAKIKKEASEKYPIPEENELKNDNGMEL